jgi:hypothetical protein
MSINNFSVIKVLSTFLLNLNLNIHLLGTIRLAKIAISENFGYNMFVTFKTLHYLNED